MAKKWVMTPARKAYYNSKKKGKPSGAKSAYVLAYKKARAKKKSLGKDYARSEALRAAGKVSPSFTLKRGAPLVAASIRKTRKGFGYPPEKISKKTLRGYAHKEYIARRSYYAQA
jgi:hypothetical protein